MNRVVGAVQGTPQVAFWGYAGGCVDDLGWSLARQLRQCEIALAGHATITTFFYESPMPIRSGAVRDVGGPPHRAGGWADLMAVLADEHGRGFEAIICATADRLSRRRRDVLARERVAVGCGVRLLLADQVADAAAMSFIRCRSGARGQRPSP